MMPFEISGARLDVHLVSRLKADVPVNDAIPKEVYHARVGRLANVDRHAALPRLAVVRRLARNDGPAVVGERKQVTGAAWEARWRGDYPNAVGACRAAMAGDCLHIDCAGVGHDQIVPRCADADA